MPATKPFDRTTCVTAAPECKRIRNCKPLPSPALTPAEQQMNPLKHASGDCGWAHRLHDAGEQTGAGAGAIGLQRTGGVPKVQVQRFAGRDATVPGPDSAEARQTLLQTDSQIRKNTI